MEQVSVHDLPKAHTGIHGVPEEALVLSAQPRGAQTYPNVGPRHAGLSEKKNSCMPMASSLQNFKNPGQLQT